MTLERFHKRWRNASLLSVFNAWVYFLSEQERLRHLIQMTLMRMTNTKLSAALQTWTKEIAAAKAKEDRCAALMRRVAARMTNGVTVRVFSAWAGWAADEVRYRVAAQRFFKRVTRRQSTSLILILTR